jgi:hypothetical protein
MDYQEAIGAGFPFSGFDLDGPGVRHRILEPGQSPRLTVRQKPSEHQKSAVGDHDVALAQKAVADRCTIG